MEPDSLDLMTTEEIATHLAKRFDALILVGYRDRTEDQFGLTTFYAGGTPMVVGLLDMARYMAMSKFEVGGEDED